MTNPDTDHRAAHRRQFSLLLIRRVELLLDGAETLIHFIYAFEGFEHHAVLQPLLDGYMHIAFPLAYLSSETAVAPEIELAGQDAHRHDDHRGQREVRVEPGEEREGGKELHEHHHHRRELGEGEGGDGAHIEGKAVEHVAAVEPLLAVDQG